ncbi:uncharacterized protein LTR77_010777 [Saxophila tyrrhenica]|uniref:Zn(2)-C6 fungal-type domain-containing protein n=1 Tax=Saxophila tyrrhenica TaxID=1690608 RepID=A0AAV9NYH0_9PEZI|nr:hypothetical protein LTR77_010777 [Saxophila tyrrhenica]
MLVVAVYEDMDVLNVAPISAAPVCGAKSVYSNHDATYMRRLSATRPQPHTDNLQHSELPPCLETLQTTCHPHRIFLMDSDTPFVFPIAESPADGASTAASPGFGSPGDSAVATSSRKRKASRRDPVTRTACARCRQSKVKCDGVHPTCSRCMASKKHCVYDVPQENMTRMQFMQAELRMKQQRYEGMQALFELLRMGEHAYACELLARIRLGEPLETLVDSLNVSTQDAPAAPPSDGHSDSTISPSIRSSDTASPIFMHSTPDNSLQRSQNLPYYSHPLPIVSEDLEGDDAASVRAEVARLRMAHSGMPQVSFGGINWPGPL